MTQNQIAYWNLQESIRTNKANEGVKQASQLETARSNRMQEALKNDIQEAQKDRWHNQSIYERNKTHLENKKINLDTFNQAAGRMVQREGNASRLVSGLLGG